MIDVSKASKISGTNIKLSALQYDKVMSCLSNAEQEAVISSDSAEYHLIEKTLNAMQKYTWFDTEKRDARCMLDYRELGCILEVLLDSLPSISDRRRNFNSLSETGQHWIPKK